MRAALWAIIRKEFRQTFRDRRMAAMLIMAPVLQLTLLGYAVDLDVDRVATAVSDHDRTPRSRALLAGLLADGTLEQVLSTPHPGRAIRDRQAHVALVLPRGLGRALTAGQPVQVQVLVDGTDPIRAQVASDASLRFFQSRALELVAERLRQAAIARGVAGNVPTISVEPRVLYNPGMRSPVYMVPGVAALVLLVVTTVVTAMGIAREREVGTIEQLLVTPIRPVVLLLGKTLPFALVGLVVAGLVLAVGTNLFDVPVRGSLAAVFAGTVLYLLSTLGSGVFISTLAQTQQQAILGSFFFLLPAILLSGFITPIENMPTWIQPITWINPVRYYVELLRAGLIKGAGFAEVSSQLTALAIFGAAILALSALRFRKRVA
jgi:ABC-2 type transport system permease protein